MSPSLDQKVEIYSEAFGPEARLLMERLKPHLPTVAARFSATFYREMGAKREEAAILASLSSAQTTDLVDKQASHLQVLLDAGTTEQSVIDAARRLGVVHALTGVSSAGIVRVVGLYRDLLRIHLDALLLENGVRYRTLQAVHVRLQLDVETQLQAMQWVLDKYQMLLARPMDGGIPAMEWMHEEVKAIAELPGIRVAVVFRPDAHNQLEIEQAAGENVGKLIDAYRAKDLYPLLDPRDARGRGLDAITWMTGCQQETVAFETEERCLPWRELMHEFGIRSAATLPVRREGGMHGVLKVFGAYPNQFSSGWMRMWVLSVQNRWDWLTGMSGSRSSAIATDEAVQIRSLLYGGGVEMFVQPVVNLADGTVVKVEALARLRLPDGSILAPGQFLPALGEADLDALFRQGLAQGLGHVRRWREQNVDVNLAVNLAPSTLVHPDCARWIEAALCEAQVPPRKLTLEVLESQTLDTDVVVEVFTRLASAGVKFSLDDFGAGFSNLKRLAELPFDVIKIDQKIVKYLRCDPVKALSLMRTVVQIGTDLNREVVAEGLEDDGAMEVASRLGCHFGQGYGVARPMPAATLVSWINARRPQGESGSGLRSWAGALAYVWMMSHDALYVPRPGDVASSPITKFLEAQEIHCPEVLRWNATIHEGPVASARLWAMEKMMQWMVNKVRAT